MSSTPTPLHNDASTLIHRTTVVLSQVQNLLRQATDIVAHLHTVFLHHCHQADPTFRQHFQPLPTPPNHPIRLPSTTSSCDSAPSRPPIRLPAPPSKDSDDTPTTPPDPQHHNTQAEATTPTTTEPTGGLGCLGRRRRLSPGRTQRKPQTSSQLDHCGSPSGLLRGAMPSPMARTQRHATSAGPATLLHTTTNRTTKASTFPITNTHITSSFPSTTFTTGFLPFPQNNATDFTTSNDSCCCAADAGC